MTSTAIRITEEALADARARIGNETPVRHWYNQEATRDAIRHFAYGIGDLNPLWSDPDYARGTRFGDVIAPPCFLHSCGQFNYVGLPGIHSMFSGTDWEFVRPLVAGDSVRATTKLVDMIERPSRFAGRSVEQLHETIYRNERSEVVARAIYRQFRTERDTAKGKAKYSTLERATYTPEQIAQIDSEVEREEVRGATPRYWEDVAEGDELGPVVKGPLTVTDMIGWLMGWGGVFVRPHRIGAEYRRRHPAAYLADEYGVPDVPERVHWDNDFARRVGVPAAYDYGPQRIAWLGQVMTNWVGDAGWVAKLSVRLRRHNLVGDTTWCRGKVARRYVEDGRHLVDVELAAVDQRGETTATGTATAELPSHEKLSSRP
ncbi:MAG: MaoC family dehydratase N-terminal domain-containing protein [Chloroflexi bacterium]|nr:MaoC family dehydratase N-terminal domain-containing protein [Chloroflexota bacterium]